MNDQQKVSMLARIGDREIRKIVREQNFQNEDELLEFSKNKALKKWYETNNEAKKKCWEESTNSQFTKKWITDPILWLDWQGCKYRKDEVYICRWFSGNVMTKQKLFQFGLVDDCLCRCCGQIDTLDHRINNCVQFQGIKEMENEIFQKILQGDVQAQKLISKCGKN
eukprot:TRINITY_DN2609_c0_g1_i8.p2 TRINITY_DN2609_c0_g1~~TRINITY_DN2609_c0_g1_i8.p2  ORF type:complete len:191 (+),score=14.65 TRINITY_DN2609_c0_g1_i8:75-575(+)